MLKLLIVEDDTYHKDLFVRAFLSARFEPTVAIDADDAIAKIDSMDFDVVVTDLMMAPGIHFAKNETVKGALTGQFLAEEIKRRKPATRVYLYSIAAEHDKAKPPFDRVFNKSEINVEELANRLQQLTAAKFRAHELNDGNTPTAVDVGIITIREDEFTAVLRRLGERRTLSMRQHYEVAELPTQTGKSLRVAAVRCPEQGQGVAQAVTRDMIEDMNPAWLFLVGIAGGFPCADYSLGDVALASRLNDFSVSAAIQDQRPEFNIGGGPMHIDVVNLLAHLPALDKRIHAWNHQRNVRTKKPVVDVCSDIANSRYYGPNWWRESVLRSIEANFNSSKARRPKVISGPTIDANTLVKDANLAHQWQQSARHTSTVEMELGGVYHAAFRGGNRNYRIVAVRGISDIIGYRRSPDWTAYACETAASFAVSLLKSGLIDCARR